MSLLSRAIANLFNGVSQQTPALRLPSQADVQENLMSDPVLGLHRRAPTEHIARIFDEPLVKPLVHTIARDAQEQYQVVIDNGDLKVFDLTGNERTVTFPQGKSYLTGIARQVIKALTIQDYTFITNTDIPPQAAVTPYKTTDQTTVTINFGSGELGEPREYPKWPDAMFYAVYKTGFTSFANPLGWGASDACDTYEEALAAWVAEIEDPGYGGTVSTFDSDPVVEEDLTNPKFRDQTDIEQEDWGHGISIKNKLAIYVQNPAVNDGNPFDPELRILYFRLGLGDGGTLEELRPDVGWPLAPTESYHVPGLSIATHIVPAFDGLLYVQVGGRLYSVGHNPEWVAEDYLAHFSALIAADFPGLELSTTTGWQLVIKAPPGEDLHVGAWDTNRRGYIRAVYSELPLDEAVFIVIKNGVAEQTYSVSLNGTIYSYTSGDTEATDTWKVDTIANQLAAEINAGTQGFEAAVYGNFIKVINPDVSPITFASHDTWNDQAMYAMKNRVQAFEDLPTNFVPGHVIEVMGDGAVGGFYVHYTKKGSKQFKAYGLDRQVQDATFRKVIGKVIPAGNTWNALEGEETGLWEECARPGTPDVLIPATMPHVLISKADGTFEFKPADWFKREAGDADSVPTPSFVGKRIVDLFFHRNRLGFMTDETVLFSRSGEFFNFWSQTAQDVLDNDPIDVQVNHTKAASLRNVATFNNVVLLFSDNTQFVVSAQNLLTPKTISIQPSTEFEVSPVKPVTVGQTVNFASQKAGWSSVWEYYVETNAVANTAANISAHIPKYIPKNVWKLEASTSLDMLLVLTDDEPDTLYVYKFLWGGAQEGKVQNSWSKWKFSADILSAAFVGSNIFLNMQREDGVGLEKLDLTPNRTEGELNWLVLLDRRVSVDGVAETVEGVDYSRHTLPYIDDDMVAVDLKTGTELAWTRVGETADVRVASDEAIDAGDIVFGHPYDSLYRFSPVYMRDKDNAPIVGSNIQLKTWSVSYERAVRFDLAVQPEGRREWVHTFRAKVTGLSVLGSGRLDAVDGAFRAQLGGNGEKTKIEVKSVSFYPFYLQNAVWEGDYSVRSRRV